MTPSNRIHGALLLAVVVVGLPASLLVAAAAAEADEATGYVHRFNYTGEVFADVHGGMKTGVVYTGLLQGSLDWHLGVWTAHGDAYLPHGDSLTQHDVGDFSVVSNIDAVHQLRLHELWGQREIGPFAARIGLLAADTEFWGSDTASLFVSSAFGAPSVVSGNLPHPPIFPQGVPGIRLEDDFDKADTLRFAVLDGDGGDPTTVNRHGLRFAFNRGALLVLEDQHLFGNPAAATATARLGVFFHTGDFATTNGTTAQGSWGLVGVIDHAINKHATWFGRIGYAEHDRSMVPWSIETGCNISGVFGPRNSLGLAVAYVDLNGKLQTPDNPMGLRHEIIAESTLNIPINVTVALQPDLQYIIDPGGSATARNALVAGFRLNVVLGR